MKNKPQKRLGRGLENLINGGLQKPQPPSVHIDRMRIEPSDVVKPPVLKENLEKELDDVLRRTQDEIRLQKESDAGSLQNTPEGLFEKPSPLKSEDVHVEKPKFKKISTTHSETPSASADAGNAAGVFMLVPIDAISISPFQRRKEFSPEAIRDLANSIRSEGLMQPIVVRVLSNGGYELIAGERRLRACQSIGMEVIPVRAVRVADASAAVMGLIENLQRVDLNPVEEARGYGMLLADFNMTQEQIAERVGKDRSTVANSLRLLLLELEILGYVAKGQLSVGHAKVLLGLGEGHERVMLARKVIEEALSVRQTEALIRSSGKAVNAPKSKRLASGEELAVIKDLEKRMEGHLNAKVSLAHSAKGGKMVVHYKSNAELEAILKKMGL